MTIEVYSPRFRNLLTSLFLGKAGGGGSVLQVLDDVLPTVQVVDPSQGEFHLPRGEIPFLASYQLVGGVGLFPTMQLRASQGFIVAIESITVHGPDAAGIDARVNLLLSPAGLYPSTGAYPADARYGPMTSFGFAAGVAIDTTAQAPTGVNLVFRPISVGMLPINMLECDFILCNPMPPPVLLSNSVPTLIVQGGTLSAAGRLTVTVAGYSRLAEPQELTAY